jgi:hypothetical protein
MLSLTTINNKKEVLDSNNEKILDLSESIFDYTDTIAIIDIVMVSNKTEGKPWIISKLYYGDESNVDILLYFNGISNPYSIKEGDMLFIPDLESARKAIVDNSSKSKSVSTKKSGRLSVTDEKRIKALISSVTGKPQDEIAIETTNQTSSSDIIIENGQIKFGNNISESKCNKDLSKTQEKSEIIRNYIKNKYSNQ